MTNSKLTGANAARTPAQQRRATSEQFQQRADRERAKQVEKQFRGGRRGH